jgi:hypothetical protein
MPPHLGVALSALESGWAGSPGNGTDRTCYRAPGALGGVQGDWGLKLRQTHQ